MAQSQKGDHKVYAHETELDDGRELLVLNEHPEGDDSYPWISTFKEQSLDINEWR